MVDAYYPGSLAEALELRTERGAIPFAGGTDLMVKYRRPAGVLPELPGPVVLLGHLDELARITEEGGILHIGAAVPLSVIESDRRLPYLLRSSASQMASPALRNVATLGGNIGNASPAGDGICALAALDARLRIAGSQGSRSISLEEFITGPGTTLLREDELITEITLRPSDCTRVFYRKVGTRKANALSKLSVCADAAVQDGVITDIRIALGAVAPKVLRMKDIEESLRGSTPEELSERIPDVLAAYEKHIRPIDDQRSTARYRKTAALRLAEEFLRNLSEEENRE